MAWFLEFTARIYNTHTHTDTDTHLTNGVIVGELWAGGLCQRLQSRVYGPHR